MFDEQQNKLRFTDWKVFIDNTSDWFDEINKRIADCYVEPINIKYLFPKIKTFASSRSAHINNYSKIKNKLDDIQNVLYSYRYNEQMRLGQASEMNIEILDKLDECVALLSQGLSEGELTPKAHKEKTPYKKTGGTRDVINKVLYTTNRTTLNKDGKATNNRRRSK